MKGARCDCEKSDTRRMFLLKRSDILTSQSKVIYFVIISIFSLCLFLSCSPRGSLYLYTDDEFFFAHIALTATIFVQFYATSVISTLKANFFFVCFYCTFLNDPHCFHFISLLFWISNRKPFLTQQCRRIWRRKHFQVTSESVKERIFHGHVHDSGKSAF